MSYEVMKLFFFIFVDYTYILNLLKNNKSGYRFEKN